MAKKNKGLANPVRLPAIDEDKQVQVVIETPKGSRNKYAFDSEQRTFKLKKVLPEGMVFPHDFGFIPSTRAEDGDPLDVLLLMDEPAFPGCLVEARLVAVIEAKQTEREGETTRNDRLIAVAADSRTHKAVRTLSDLNDTLMDEVEHFFISYNQIKGKKFEPLGRFGHLKAAELVADGMKRFKQKMKKQKHRKS